MDLTGGPPEFLGERARPRIGGRGRPRSNQGERSSTDPPPLTDPCGPMRLPQTGCGGDSAGGRFGVVPKQKCVFRVIQQDLRWEMFVDVADQAVVDPVPDQLLQPTRKMLDCLAGDTQLLVLLLPDVAGAVIHGDTDPIGVSGVGAA